MGTVSIVLVLTLGFAAANLYLQMLAVEIVRRGNTPKLPALKVALEHPDYSRIDGMPRVRTDRHDLLIAIGHDFAAPDVEQSVWPRDPRI